MSAFKNSSETLFELGRLYAERCDFKPAVEKLHLASQAAVAEQDMSAYLKAQNLLLRIYAEQEDDAAVADLKARLQELVLKEQIELTSKTYYTLALCTAHKQEFPSALEYLEKALALGLSKDNKEDICYAIYGFAAVYAQQGRNEEALKEIYNLQVFHQVVSLPDLKIASQILNAFILRKLGKFDQATEILWRCYDDLKGQKNLYMYVMLLDAMGSTYLERGDFEMARMYLDLARRMADADNLRHFCRNIEKRMAALGQSDPRSNYDLIFNQAAKSVVERTKGRIDFNNQFILLDMLRLFMRQPGEVYTKEELVQKVWRQEYNPEMHDNKIYVTIKRLRQLIEPDFDRPRYIFRAKNGYYLNRDARILIESAPNEERL